MIQFLTDIYNYIFPVKNTTTQQLNLYKIMKTKHFQKYNNRYSKYNKYIYKDYISVYSIDYKQITDIYVLLQKLVLLSHDIICISSISNTLQSYNDGSKYIVIYTADFIARIMDMYYIVGNNSIILSRLPIHNHKTYITDELYNNYIQRITIYVNEKYVNIYNATIYPNVVDYSNYTNTFITNLLEDNYNKIPFIITGVINHTIYSWIMSFNKSKSKNSNVLYLIEASLLPLKNAYTPSQFIYVNSLWCNNFIYTVNIINDTEYSLNTTIKINN
jgi:hypothetical protein